MINKKINTKNEVKKFNKKFKKINHQRFNSHNKMSNINNNLLNKLTLSINKTEKSEEIKYKKCKKKNNLKNELNILKLKADNVHIKKIKKLSTNLKKRIKENSIKFNIKKKKNNSHNNKLNKNNKIFKKKKNKSKEKSISKINFINNNLCNIRLKNTSLSAKLNNELFNLKNIVDSKISKSKLYFDEIIDNFNTIKMKIIKDLQTFYETSNNNILKIIKKIDSDRIILDNIINNKKYNNPPFILNILKNLTLNNGHNLANYNIKWINNSKLIDSINSIDIKKNIKGFIKPFKFKNILDYNNYINSIEVKLSNKPEFKTLNNHLNVNFNEKFNYGKIDCIKGSLSPSGRNKKIISWSIADKEYYYSHKIDENNSSKEENELGINNFFSKKENMDENIDNYSSINLKCSEELDYPLKNLF